MDLSAAFLPCEVQMRSGRDLGTIDEEWVEQ